MSDLWSKIRNKTADFVKTNSSCTSHGILVPAHERIATLLEQFKDSRVGVENENCYRVWKENRLGDIRKWVTFGIYYTQLEEAKESPENFHSFIYRAIKSLIYLRQWFLNCKLEQGTDILNLSHCFALIKDDIESPESFAWYKYHHFHRVFFRNLQVLLVWTWWHERYKDA